MPIIKSAKKKLRQDKRETARNLQYKNAYKRIIKKLQKNDKSITLKDVYSKLDKAAKKGIITKNKAARLKSKIARRHKSQ